VAPTRETVTSEIQRCPICDAEAHFVQEMRSVSVGRREATVSDSFFRCGECSEEFYLPGQMDVAQALASRKIREDEDLLQPEEIRRIRERLGLTQADLETLLGTGPKTVVRWEKGTVFQNKATDSLLRIISELPEAARFLATRNSVEIHPVVPTQWAETSLPAERPRRVWSGWTEGGSAGQSADHGSFEEVLLERINHVRESAPACAWSNAAKKMPASLAQLNRNQWIPRGEANVC